MFRYSSKKATAQYLLLLFILDKYILHLGNTLTARRLATSECGRVYSDVREKSPCANGEFSLTLTTLPYFPSFVCQE